MTLAELEIPISPSPHRWSFDDFMRASEAGLFDSQRVELIEGELIDVPAQKDPHAWTVSRMVWEIRRVFPDPFWIKMQATVRLNENSGPEPDIAVMSGPPIPPATVAPSPLLFIEVSETTLSYDLGAKASLYAANGIADYWVADVIAKQVHIHRDPIRDDSQKYGWRFEHITTSSLGQKIAPLSRPESTVDVAAFLG